MAKCCKPAPPDPIVGFITRGKGVSVHRKTCKNIAEMKAKSPERIVPTQWGEIAADMRYPIDIFVLSTERQGILRDISDIFLREKISVSGVQTQNSKGYARMTFTAEIASVASLNKAQNMICEVQGVLEVKRR